MTMFIDIVIEMLRTVICLCLCNLNYLFMYFVDWLILLRYLFCFNVFVFGKITSFSFFFLYDEKYMNRI